MAAWSRNARRWRNTPATSLGSTPRRASVAASSFARSTGSMLYSVSVDSFRTAIVVVWPAQRLRQRIELRRAENWARGVANDPGIAGLVSGRIPARIALAHIRHAEAVQCDRDRAIAGRLRAADLGPEQMIRTQAQRDQQQTQLAIVQIHKIDRALELAARRTCVHRRVAAGLQGAMHVKFAATRQPPVTIHLRRRARLMKQRDADERDIAAGLLEIAEAQRRQIAKAAERPAGDTQLVLARTGQYIIAYIVALEAHARVRDRLGDRAAAAFHRRSRQHRVPAYAHDITRHQPVRIAGEHNHPRRDMHGR